MGLTSVMASKGPKSARVVRAPRTSKAKAKAKPVVSKTKSKAGPVVGPMDLWKTIVEPEQKRIQGCPSGEQLRAKAMAEQQLPSAEVEVEQDASAGESAKQLPSAEVEQAVSAAFARLCEPELEVASAAFVDRLCSQGVGELAQLCRQALIAGSSAPLTADASVVMSPSSPLPWQASPSLASPPCSSASSSASWRAGTSTAGSEATATPTGVSAADLNFAKLLGDDHFGDDMKTIFAKSQEQAKDDATEAEKELKTIMEAGGLDLRSKWGLRFSRAADGAKSPEYKGSRDDRAQFRADWVKVQFAKKQEIREKQTSYKKVNFKRGSYRPFSMIYKKQGGAEDPGAMQATLNICRACMKMGGEWLNYNKMSDRIEFFDLEVGWEKDFSEAWSLYERQVQDSGGLADKKGEDSTQIKGDNEGDKSNEGEPKPKAKPTKGQKRTAQQGLEDKEAEKNKDGEKGKRTKTSLDVALSEALQLKKEFGSTMLVAQELQKRAEIEQKFEWAVTDMARLSLLLSVLSRAVTPFGKHFLTTDLKDIKKGYKDRNQILEQEVVNFLSQARDPLKKVAQHTKLINVTLAARNNMI